MASRRVRIKGIANIPQRRKPGSGPADSEKNYTEVKSEQKELNLADTPPSVKENKDEGKETQVPQETENETKSDDAAQASISVSSPVTIVNLTESPQKENSVKRDVAVIPKKELEEGNNVINIAESENDEMSPEATGKAACQPTTKADIPKPTLPVRRRFLKPTVKPNIINRKLKDKAEEPKTEQDKENLEEPVNINLNETVISTNSTNISPLIQKIDSTSLGPYITKSGLPHLVKYNRENSTKSGSDTEYPPPPPSPNKLLNRTRIKAVPRLDQRRTSFSIGSASESEDDTRRSYTRIRNDSVCSVASGVNETLPSTEAASPVRKELISVIQRKCRRTEQSRKLAEARREFYMKFHNGTPDKQRLTMIDLIFYNPTSNPMTQKKKRKISELKEEPENTSKLQNNEHIASKLEKMEEERIDDPLALSDDEEENELPAPQIKIGTNGEIVVDEKSLVIEHTDAKKGREALANSEIVDGDFDSSYGVYKRVKRSKDWSREETLRFYKALNTIGTDFTMMCELFPKRTRRELKMKFKKEERMNKNLVDKAVMRPVEFDLTELRRDLEIEERREEEMKQRKREKEEMREKIKTKKKKSEIKGIDNINEEQENIVQVKKLPPKRERKSVKSSYDVLKNGINSVLDDSEDNLPTTFNKLSDSGEESSEEDDPLFTPITPKKRLNILKPKIKKNKKFKKTKINDEEENHTSKNQNKSDAEEQCKELVNNDESVNQNLEPGSIMIVSSKMPNGETLYKVFMVTDQQNKQPINLEPNMLQNLTQNLGAQQATTNYQNILTISAQKQIENNVTINEEQELQDGGRLETNSRLIVNETEIITSDNIPVVQNIPENFSEITSDSIIFPFDEYINSAKQNITLSHEDSKLVIVTEKSNN